MGKFNKTVAWTWKRKQWSSLLLSLTHDSNCEPEFLRFLLPIRLIIAKTKAMTPHIVMSL
jgi:hypothetical protein